jgi:predicted RNA-binding protein with PIN domain
VRWLIDGYNVVRRDPDLRAHEAESLAAGRSALLRLLARVARDSTDDFIVVFDGARRATGPPPDGGAAARVRLVFSTPPRTADEVLIAEAARWREGAIVVSSDRAVHDAARRAGAIAVTAEEFLRRVDGGADDGDEDDDAPGERPRGKVGNPRRLSKNARAARRALGRLPRR